MYIYPVPRKNFSKSLGTQKRDISQFLPVCHAVVAFPAFPVYFPAKKWLPPVLRSWIPRCPPVVCHLLARPLDRTKNQKPGHYNYEIQQ